MQLRDKTAYAWGLRYRWDPSLSRKPLPRFLHFMPPCSLPKLINIDFDKIQRLEGPFLLPVPYKSWATFYLCCQFISDYVTWGPFLPCVPYKSWATFYAVNLSPMMHRHMNWNCNQAMIMTKLIINLGGDSGGGGGGAQSGRKVH